MCLIWGYDINKNISFSGADMWRWVTHDHEDSIPETVQSRTIETDSIANGDEFQSSGLDQGIPVIKQAKMCDQRNIVLSWLWL